jgi:hypothetical protein
MIFSFSSELLLVLRVIVILLPIDLVWSSLTLSLVFAQYLK